MMRSRWGLTWVAVGVLAFCQLACTSMVPLQAPDAATMLEGLEVGDRLSVSDAHGIATELDVTAVGADFIEGTSVSGEPLRIAAADVSKISVRRVVPGKTIALGASVGFVLFVHTIMTGLGLLWE